MKLKTDYQTLPALFYTKKQPEPAPKPELVVLNEVLAKKLGLNPDRLREHPGLFTGNELPEDAVPIAQAYSGHQFGYFTRLGDGRAILLGELEQDGVLYDIHLKGAGRTPYSRGGDGKAALAPMLREYLIAEAMQALGIPTTRSLAVATTGETVLREAPFPGAVLTRVAKSHLRVGTFQYALEAGGKEAVLALADYARKRHGISSGNEPLLSLFSAVLEKQAKLIAAWMSIGFIHGVMNTDNMTISGETIDYGPCAFLDEYDAQAVFSSIDSQGRYAYGNQPMIGKWNLARFAEVLLGAADDADALLPQMEAALARFDTFYEDEYERRMAAKLGLPAPKEKDKALIKELLQCLQEMKADYTNTFVRLTKKEPMDPRLADWQKKRSARLEEIGETEEVVRQRMQAANPVLIPRNHIVEQVLAQAVQGDLIDFLAFAKRLQHPYEYDLPTDASYSEPMPDSVKASYRTYCGT